MFQTLLQIIYASWDVLLDSSLYVIFGFFIAGLLKAFIPDDFIQRHFGKGGTSSVIKASLFGIPIPLCSCGVIPAAAGLREQGASKGAVSSFMISTPETGVDSIALTYALLDPIMTVIRPVSAFFTAALTGTAINFMESRVNGKAGTGDNQKNSPISNNSASVSTIDSLKTDSIKMTGSSCSCSGGCSGHNVSSDSKANRKNPASITERFRQGMRFAFVELLGDIGPWLLVGVLLAGIITVFITPEFIESYLGDGIFSMLIMIALATPLYVCATASTPIAAALALKGLSPGAALVFLLAGPATNVATITVVSKLLGKKATVIYLGSIMVCSLIMGIMTNLLYDMLGLDITGWVNSNSGEQHGIIEFIAAVFLLYMVIKPFKERFLNFREKKGHSHCNCHH